MRVLKWLASLFKGRNGPDPECGSVRVTKRNVDHHTRRISMELKRLDRELATVMPRSEEAPVE